METNQARLIALVNRFADAHYPRPDDHGPIGPWGPWIREAIEMGPLPEPWGAHFGGFAGQVDDHGHPFGGRQPRPNWMLAAMLRNLAFLNPQPQPVDCGIGLAKDLAHVALRRAREAGGEQGSRLLLRFCDDWCGNGIRIPFPPKPGDPGEPRPPRPEESMVLGAALVRAAASSEDVSLKRAAEDVGSRIFEHGLSSLG